MKNLTDLDSIIFSAFRYALGRQTHIVATTVDFIRNNLDLVPVNLRKQMIEEINQAERREYGYSLGEEYHRNLWLDLRDFLKKESYESKCR